MMPEGLLNASAWLGRKIVREATTWSSSFAVRRGMAAMFLSFIEWNRPTMRETLIQIERPVIG